MFLVLISLSAAIVASITGFGAAVVLSPFVAVVIDLKQAIVLVAYFVLFTNIFNVIRLKRHIHLKMVVLFGLPSMLTTLGGAILFNQLDVKAISVILAIIILAFVAYSFSNKQYEIPRTNGTLILGGALSGVMAGLVGMGGPLRSMFLLSSNSEKYSYIATSSILAVLVSTTRIGVYLYNGDLQEDYYIYILPLIVIAFFGTYVGLKLLSRLSNLAIKRTVLLVLVVLAIKLLLD